MVAALVELRNAHEKIGYYAPHAHRSNSPREKGSKRVMGWRSARCLHPRPQFLFDVCLKMLSQKKGLELICKPRLYLTSIPRLSSLCGRLRGQLDFHEAGNEFAAQLHVASSSIPREM